MSIKVNDAEFQKLVDELEQLGETVMKQAHIFYRRETPIRSGNARSKTHRKDLTIKSQYAYAARLDEGWSSQSPKGMTGPTSDAIEQYVENYIKRVI